MNVKTRIAAGISAATIAAASVFIVGWEGNKTKPYLDVGGVPTACAGVTKGIDFSKIYTEAECSAMNAEQIQLHAQEIMACVTRPISQDEQVAIFSLGYNIGSTATCKSTLVRKMNAGEPYCDEYLRFNKIRVQVPLLDEQGKAVRGKDGKPVMVWQLKEVRGLTNRRTAERALCMKGTQQ